MSETLLTLNETAESTYIKASRRATRVATRNWLVARAMQWDRYAREMEHGRRVPTMQRFMTERAVEARIIPELMPGEDELRMLSELVQFARHHRACYDRALRTHAVPAGEQLLVSHQRDAVAEVCANLKRATFTTRMVDESSR